MFTGGFGGAREAFGSRWPFDVIYLHPSKLVTEHHPLALLQNPEKQTAIPASNYTSNSLAKSKAKPLLPFRLEIALVDAICRRQQMDGVWRTGTRNAVSSEKNERQHPFSSLHPPKKGPISSISPTHRIPRNRSFRIPEANMIPRPNPSDGISRAACSASSNPQYQHILASARSSGSVTLQMLPSIKGPSWSPAMSSSLSNPASAFSPRLS